jgi:hypothetical protein
MIKSIPGCPRATVVRGIVCGVFVLQWVAVQGQEPAAEQPPPPVVRQQSVRTVIRNGERTIEVSRGEETIQIKDSSGKQISVRHTRSVDGKPVTDVYEAADLDALKKAHPKGAELYREFTEREAAPVWPPAGRRANGFLTGALQPLIGDRRIRATLRGQHVEIHDRFGRQIRMRVRRQSPADSPVEEFSAESVEELRKTSTAAADLFEQLAGRR